MVQPNGASLHGFFGEPPETAISYLENKQLVPTKHWHDLRDGAHNQAFTVANLSRIDLLDDIKQSLIDAQKKGLTMEQWRSQITPVLKSKGWWGKDENGREMGTPWRLETIYRTNLQAAYMAGRRHEMLQATDTHPYWRYVAIMDNRTRPAHRALHDRVMRADDGAWDSIFPPCGFNCRCRVSPMTENAVGRGHYTVESSEGHLETDIVAVGQGESARITKLKLPSMDIPFKTDAGFNAAPSTGATTKLIEKTAPDIVRKLPEHPIFDPSKTTVDDFVKLGKQRLDDVFNIPATADKTVKQILDEAKSSVEYLPHHAKMQQWLTRELERTRQAGSVTAEIQGNAQAQQLIKDATKSFPADWIKAANNLGDLNVRFSQARGLAYTSPINQRVNLLGIGIVQMKAGEGWMVVGRLDIAIHEFTHRIQSARPDIDDLFQQEHRLRTAKEPLQSLRTLMRNAAYAEAEVARPDGYYTPYMGKEYPQYKGREALEVMTMAIQPILSIDDRDARMLFKLYKNDSRMLELTLGILFHAR